MKVPDSMREGHDSIGDEHQLSLKLCVLPRQSLPASKQTLKPSIQDIATVKTSQTITSFTIVTV